jgi:two-component system KDP operon response regulator KdpE
MTTRILVVDDDATLLRFLGEYLVREGFEVISADRGAKAVKLFYQERPDIVVLDLMMPGMDGWEVCARLREMADTPIILLTAKASEADKLRGFRLGVDDYVTKPFSLAELAARLKAVLARASAPGRSCDRPAAGRTAERGSAQTGSQPGRCAIDTHPHRVSAAFGPGAPGG